MLLTFSTSPHYTTGPFPQLSHHLHLLLTFLPRAFTSLDRIIFMDSTDLEFFDDVLQLEKQFDAMSEGSVISVGLDLSPHYRKFLAEYLAINPQVAEVPVLTLPRATWGWRVLARASTPGWSSSAWTG